MPKPSDQYRAMLANPDPASCDNSYDEMAEERLQQLINAGIAEDDLPDKEEIINEFLRKADEAWQEQFEFNLDYKI